jgi:zinc protease
MSFSRQLQILGVFQKPARLAVAVVALCACTPAKPGLSPGALPSPSPEAPSTPAPSRSEPSSPFLPFDPRVVSGSLPNGLTYYLQQHESKDKRAHLMLVVKAGSLYEEEDQRGLAHFVEHMAFNGTRRFEKQTLVDFFEKSGLKFGSHANAMTLFDRTQYQLSVPTNDPRLLLTALDVLEDWADGLTFDPEEVQKERQVLLAEWTSSRGASRRIGEQQRRLLTAGSKYAEREVIGDKAVLQGAPVQRVVDFYRRWYRPARMAVIAVGDFEPAALEAAIAARFSRLPPAVAGESNPSFDIPIRREPTAAVIADPESPATMVSLLFKASARPFRTEADYRARLVSALPAIMLSRRLDALSEKPDAPFTGAGSNFAPGVLGQLDLLMVSARAKEGQAQQSLDSLLLELERVKRHGFVQTELDRTKREYERSLEHQLAAQDTVEGMALAGALANSFVTGNTLTSPELQQKLGARLLSEITVAELNQDVLRAVTQAEELLLMSGASRDALPEKASLLGARSAVATRAVEPYTEDAGAARLMAALPTPGSIVKEERIAEIGVTVWTLSNGARVVLKPTDFKNDEILEQSISFGGNVGVSEEEFQSARHAHAIVSASGVAAFDRQKLNRLLAGKVVSAYPWIDEQNEGIRASAAPQDVETMFQLIHLYASAPRRDEAAFETYRAGLREGLRNRDLNPAQVFSDAVTKRLWGDKPRRSPPTLASVDAMNLDVALTFYKQRFADVSDFTFVFVGKLDEPSFRPLVERYLASLPGSGRKETFRDIGLHRRKGITEVRVQNGKDDKATVTFIYHGETPWSENAHTDLDTLERYLSIRLREVLREQLGGVYTPVVSSSFERVPFDSYSLVLGFECKPNDIEKLQQATRGVIAELEKSGAAESYIEKLKNQRTVGLEEAYRANSFWLERLVDKYKMGEDPRQILILHELTKRITSDNLRHAARQFLRHDQYVDARRTPAPEAKP